MPVPAAETWPVLDPAAIAALAQLDPTGRSNLLVRVLHIYLQSKRRLAQGLAQAQAAGDLHGILLSAHTLKSASASIGASTLAKRCGVVESVLRARDCSRLPDVISGVLLEAERVEQAVQALLGEFSTATPK